MEQKVIKENLPSFKDILGDSSKEVSSVDTSTINSGEKPTNRINKTPRTKITKKRR